MVKVFVDTRGWDEFRLDMKRFPGRLASTHRKANLEIMRRMKLSATLRAPKRTGEMARSTLIRQGRNADEIILTNTSPYSIFQEEGYTPHSIPTDYFNVNGSMSPADLLDPNRKFKERRGIFSPSGFAFVRKHKAFMKPAAEAIMPKMPDIYAQYMRREFIPKRYGG